MTAMTELERELNAALEKDLPGAKLKHEPAMPRTTTFDARTPHQQLEAFMASSTKMLEMQRRQLIQSESDYQLERLKLLDSYRIKIETLRNECADAVRALDLRHKESFADAQNLLNRLAAMRALD